VCGACPWTDAEEFSLSMDKNFFLHDFWRKKIKMLDRGQMKILLFVWPALRMMLMNFHFFLQGFQQ
jgi:hypothetical protein